MKNLPPSYTWYDLMVPGNEIQNDFLNEDDLDVLIEIPRVLRSILLQRLPPGCVVICVSQWFSISAGRPRGGGGGRGALVLSYIAMFFGWSIL